MIEESYYLIRICNGGPVDWVTWFDGLSVEERENGEIILCGFIQDQAALHGLLNKIRALGFCLISIEQVKE